MASKAFIATPRLNPSSETNVWSRFLRSVTAISKFLTGPCIEIGGKDNVATLSARLGNDAKRSDARLRLVAGKWHLPEWISESDDEETADTPTKDAPAASFFSNQEGGESYAPALA